MKIKLKATHSHNYACDFKLGDVVSGNEESYRTDGCRTVEWYVLTGT